MRHRELRFAAAFALVVAAFTACTTPNPNRRKLDGGVEGDGGGGSCEAGAALRCDGTDLVRCKPEGIGEVREPCALGCNASALRCFDANPSNGLAKFFDQSSGQPDLNLGDSATINTDTGEVKVGGSVVAVKNEMAAQPGAPTIRVFVVRSLVAKDVAITGKNALAIVSSGDIKLKGLFSVSAKLQAAGPGAFTEIGCRGQKPPTRISSGGEGGTGGGGFGSRGGSGGSAQKASELSAGGAGGAITGNEPIVPLRGGCDGGIQPIFSALAFPGGGGGAVQLVSRTLISAEGTVAANGGGGRGGGSGGGILLEAPVVEVSGGVVANGGSAASCQEGADGHLDATPASGGLICDFEFFGMVYRHGTGGNGAASSVDAADGLAVDVGQSNIGPYGGCGGGGVGRIRVNTATGAVGGTGIFSPPPSTGTLGTR